MNATLRTQSELTRGDVLAWIARYAGVIAENRQWLTDLDAAIGDGDHGANMDRGFQAVLAKLPALAEADIGAIFKAVGMTLLSTVGGASGPLYGTFFLQAAQPLAGRTELELNDWIAAVEMGVNGIIKRGRAEVGEKTMVDALAPALAALKAAAQAGMGWKPAVQRAADAAHQGALSTVPLVARKGRASYLGERSAGHQDPGATSAFLLFDSLAQVVNGADTSAAPRSAHAA